MDVDSKNEISSRSRDLLGDLQLTTNKFGIVYIPEELQGPYLNLYAQQPTSFFRKMVEVAHTGNESALSVLAMLCFNGALNAGRDRLNRTKTLAESASRIERSGYSSYILGLCHLEEREFAKSFAAFERSSDSGFSPAIWMLGIFYERGIAVPADSSCAAKYFLKSAQAGYVFGRPSYVNLLETGCLGNLNLIRAKMIKPWTEFILSLRLRFSSYVLSSHLLPERLGHLIGTLPTSSRQTE